jgi:hypothetical protein
MHAVTVNRAPVLTLWCAVVAEHLGFERDEVRKAMMQLATAREPERLASEAYALYEEFRPDGPAGKKGRGVAGALSLDTIRALAGKRGAAR